MAPAIGVDLGNSSRAPHIAGLAGEDEDHGPIGPGITAAQQGSMAGMGHESGMKMDRGPMSGMNHGSMVGIDHRAMSDMPMDRGVMPGMRAPGDKMQMAHSGRSHSQGTGTVNSVDAVGHKLNVSHEPIPTIGWPAMTMDFAVAPSVDLHGVRPGARINFTMEPGNDGMYVIQSITPTSEGGK
jgi:Cu/Ag efflux protein CusF